MSLNISLQCFLLVYQMPSTKVVTLTYEHSVAKRFLEQKLKTQCFVAGDLVSTLAVTSLPKPSTKFIKAKSLAFEFTSASNLVATPRGYCLSEPGTRFRFLCPFLYNLRALMLQ